MLLGHICDFSSLNYSKTFGDSSCFFIRKSSSQLRFQTLPFRLLVWTEALVDVPLYLSILLLMQIMDYIFSPDESVFIIPKLQQFR